MKTFVSLLFSPETKDLELSAVGEDQASPASLGFGEVPVGKPQIILGNLRLPAIRRNSSQLILQRKGICCQLIGRAK